MQIPNQNFMNNVTHQYSNQVTKSNTMVGQQFSLPVSNLSDLGASQTSSEPRLASDTGGIGLVNATDAFRPGLQSHPWYNLNTEETIVNKQQTNILIILLGEEGTGLCAYRAFAC